MKERPILFSGPMVRASLRDKNPKTQTRRVVKPQPPYQPVLAKHLARRGYPIWHCEQWKKLCPYGQPGDRLYVRETWCCVHGIPDADPDDFVRYRADDGPGEQVITDVKGWHPSIHMPRVYSRITMEIVSVRVERLQDISDADALSEGIVSENVIVGCNCYGGHHVEESADRYFFDGCAEEGFESAVDAYAGLWESINGPGSWAANPWVWCIEFKRVTP